MDKKTELADFYAEAQCYQERVTSMLAGLANTGRLLEYTRRHVESDLDQVKCDTERAQEWLAELEAALTSRKLEALRRVCGYYRFAHDHTRLLEFDRPKPEDDLPF